MARTRLLLHLVDIAPLEETSAPADEITAIINELKIFDTELANRERWLILNKKDLLPAAELEHRKKELIQALNWQGEVHAISALSGEGCRPLCHRIMQKLEDMDRLDETQS